MIRMILFPLSLLFFVGSLGYAATAGRSDIELLNTQIADARKKLEEMQRKRQNVTALENVLNTNTEQEKFANTYLPPSAYEERALNTLNYVIHTTGLTILNMTVESSKNKNGGEDGENVMGKRTLTLDVVGEYEKLKAFIDQLFIVDALHKVTKFIIAKPEVPREGKVPEGLLHLSASIDFLDYPRFSVKDEEYHPVFDRGTFDMTPLQKARNIVTGQVPSVDVGANRKGNIFNQ